MNDSKYDLQAKPPNEMQFSYGGQAVIEGVMMRGAHIFAVAVRSPQGEIVVHEASINQALYRGRISRTPFLRGLVGLWDSLGLGTRALMWSADIAAQEDDTPADTPKPNVLVQLLTLPLGMSSPVTPGGKSIDFNGPVGWVTVAFSLLLGVGFFFVVPVASANFVAGLLGIEALLLINLIEGVIQLGLLIGYISLIAFMPDVKRLFGYHGAEHKTINAYEAGAELTPEVVQQYPIEHPRCGTAFLLTVAFVSILTFAILDSIFGRSLITRLVCIPLIAGIAYEILRFTARNIDKPLVRLMVIPNLALQHLTTRQPDLTMIEVAIVAFKRVLTSEQLLHEDKLAPVPATSPVPIGD